MTEEKRRRRSRIKRKFKLKKRFKKKKEEEPMLEFRTILFNHYPPVGVDFEQPPQNFPSNEVKTSHYTLLNFLPKNLFEQFRRLANFYFLCLVIISFVIDSPVSPLTSLLPLLFVIAVTGVKQAYEDYKRHKEDNKINNTKTCILKDEDFVEIEQCKIVVGDIVQVKVEQEFPCDLLLVTSPTKEKTCDVTTANLDGETNIKTMHSPEDLKYLKGKEDLLTVSAIVECQQPTTNLYEFRGRMELYGDSSEPTTFPLGIDNFLPRGAKLKNTPYIYGLALYTGLDTKVALNSKLKSNKFSTLERTMNYYLLSYLALLIFEVFLCTLLKYQVYDLTTLEDMWYLQDIELGDGPSFSEILEDAFSFFVLFSYLIPISLYVTLEMQKFLCTFFYIWDDELRCPNTGERAICNTSDLNEELGQIQYLFTDKTGTLTENIMYFRQCSVGGVKFFDGRTSLQSIDEESVQPLPKNIYNQIEFFLITLALCHTVKVKRVPIKDDASGDESSDDGQNIEMGEYKWEYSASSPDEKALVEACEKYGVTFEGEEEGKCFIRLQDKIKVYKRLEILEFDSDRKLMSVIVEDTETGDIWLLSKGAEVSVLKRCLIRDKNDEELRDLTLKHIDDYAALGLRTLAVARKKLEMKKYQKISLSLSRAREVIEGREEAVRKVMDNIEKDLTLLGSTGVEDLLQEGVPETLESLYVAGIKVWVLTGDKVETAINIAHLCGLFKRFMTILHLTHLDTIESVDLKIDQCEDELEENPDGTTFGLVVDGTSLLILLEECADEFFDICSECSAVICCRMSPKQKAEIVKLVKTKGGPSVVTAAIGDGANDVSMIQEAHLGIGIVGKEGRQAVMSSDFAFSRFRYLQKTLLVHGHWFYIRGTTLVQYCFYKNVTFITPQFIYTFLCAFSLQSIYDGGTLTMFNTAYTALPIIIYGLFEQPYDQDTLVAKPYLYKTISGNKNMIWRVFFTWAGLGFWHATVCFFGLLAVAYDDTSMVLEGHARVPDLYSHGMALTTLIILVVTFKLLIESKHHNLFLILSMILSVIFYDIFVFIYQGFVPIIPNYWAIFTMYTSWAYWFSFAVLMTICLLPDVLIKIYQTTKFSMKYNMYQKETKLMTKIRKLLKR